MAISPIDTTSSFNAKYSAVATATMSTDGIIEKFDAKIKEYVDSWDIKTEDKGMAYLNAMTQLSATINRDVISAAIKLVELDYNVAVSVAQGNVYERQKAGYDDNLYVKAAEFEGNLASFAVNANSTTAQTSIDTFKATISTLKSRAS